MVTRVDIEERIKTKMDHLQKLMEANAHLDRQEYVLDVIYSAEKYFTAMNDEDREYLQISRSAVEDGIKWNVPEEKKLTVTEDDGYAD
jgi:hypothetical protein